MFGAPFLELWSNSSIWNDLSSQGDHLPLFSPRTDLVCKLSLLVIKVLALPLLTLSNVITMMHSMD